MRVVVCPRCQYLDGCRYHELMDLAEQAPHRIATHKRAQLTAKGLARNRKGICIHEDAASILRPVWEADRGTHEVSQLVHLASKDASYSEDDLRWFFHEMEKLSDHLDKLTLVSDVTTHIDFNLSALPRQHYQNRLWYAMQENQDRCLAAGHASRTGDDGSWRLAVRTGRCRFGWALAADDRVG